MLKKIFLLLFILPSFTGFAQSNIPIPMKNGIIFYEKSYNSNLSKQELYSNAEKWLKNYFPEEKKIIKTPGEIAGTGIFKIVTSQSGNYYWLRFNISIAVNDNGYTLKAFNVYEKPIESGISNEYSKLEYRWWDFRQGKPWSAEDEPLFKGLDLDMTSMMTSFEKNTSK